MNIQIQGTCQVLSKFYELMHANNKMVTYFLFKHLFPTITKRRLKNRLNHRINFDSDNMIFLFISSCIASVYNELENFSINNTANRLPKYLMNYRTLHSGPKEWITERHKNYKYRTFTIATGYSLCKYIYNLFYSYLSILKYHSSLVLLPLALLTSACLHMQSGIGNV